MVTCQSPRCWDKPSLLYIIAQALCLFAVLFWALPHCGGVVVCQKCPGFQYKGTICFFPLDSSDDIYYVSLADHRGMRTAQSRGLYNLSETWLQFHFSFEIDGEYFE